MSRSLIEGGARKDVPGHDRGQCKFGACLSCRPVAHHPSLQAGSGPRARSHLTLLVSSPRRRLLETAAPRVPHRHRASSWLLQGHQESHHPHPDEEGRPSGLYSAASGDRTQEIPSGPSEKRARVPRNASRCQPTRGAGGAGQGAPWGTEAARHWREQALVVVLLHVAELGQAALAAQVLGASGHVQHGDPAASGPGSWLLISSPQTTHKPFPFY